MMQGNYKAYVWLVKKGVDINQTDIQKRNLAHVVASGNSKYIMGNTPMRDIKQVIKDEMLKLYCFSI